MITAARNYELGADGRLRARRAAVHRCHDDPRSQGRRRAGLPDRLRLRLRAHRQRLVDGQEDRRRPALPGPEHGRRRAGHGLRDRAGEVRGRRQAHRQHHHLGDHRRDSGRGCVAHQRACLPGPADMATCVAGARSPTAARARSPSSWSTTGSTCCMGGGKNRYAQATDAGPSGADLRTRRPRATGWSRTRPRSRGVTSLEDGPVLGLFAGGNMTPMNQPLVATAPPGAGGPARECQPADRGNQPDLSAMTDKAIELLDNPEGLLPAGRERDGRQAGARLGHLRRDR